MTKPLLFTFLSVVIAFSGFSQSNNPYYVDNRGRDALLAPRLGIGAGVFTFFGDVNDNNYQHIFTSTYGVQVVGSGNVSRYFDVDLSAIYGVLSVNERSSARSLNFRSETFIGTAGISYNFNHLYRKPGIVQPFVGVGVSFINFDSKSDLYDANGNRYYYWSDGSIMSLAENDANSEAAIPLQRDYTYETDLRDENQDGLGKYDQFTFSVPVSLGIDFKMGHRLSARLSSSFYYTFTDLIDDISDKGSGTRQGNSRNDMLLFTSMSVSYSIGVQRDRTKSQKEKYFEGVDFYAVMIADSDNDGVNDFDDRCAQTPEGVKVDEKGCPLDTDTDVIPDYRDKEDSTKQGAVVNLEGITLTDEMIAEQYDSVATERARMHTIYPSGILSRKAAMTAEDSTKLAILMLDIQNKVEGENEFDKLFDEVSKQVFNEGIETAASVEDVYEKVEKVYQTMVEKQEIAPSQPLVITKEERVSTTIPPQFADADYNRDGLITADEVMRVIEEVLDETSQLTVSQLFNLIDFYHEYMEDAKVINFGGTMAVYIDGTLNILENYRNDGLTDTQRYLASKFNLVDTNGDGKLSPDEVNRMISKYQSGNAPYTEAELNELIDLYFED
ncbi:MAG: hypothetical protein EP314_06230 [Bacteroidetes bacterium]|nr:MAG: hypothetical protein EP314_06230 [Bacteroidota bacterium]